MRSLVLFVATTAVVSGLRDIAPGFAADFRSFGDTSNIYQQQRLPHREQSRSFRETSQAPTLHQLQSFREEPFREYRQPFGAREESKNLHHEARGGFKDDSRLFKEGNRVLEDELRSFNVDSRNPFKEDSSRIFSDEIRSFGDERPFRNDLRTVHEGPRHFREERPGYREEIRHFREELRPFRDEIRHFESPRPFRDEYRPFREDPRIFRDDGPFKEESGPFRGDLRPFRDERPFKEESGPYRHDPRPFRDERQFKDESVTFRNEPRPFKDELLFTEESQSLAEAQHRFNKEHQHRQPLSFGGHSSYLKFGNHGLGFASVPTAILPLEDHSSRHGANLAMSTAAPVHTPDFATSQVTSSPRDVDSKILNSVTLPPDVGSTISSHSTSSNPFDSNAATNQRKNENLFGSTSSASTAATISTSGGTNASPKVVFGSGSGSVSSQSMGITSAVGATGIQPTITPSVNSLQASKTSMHVVGTPGSYFSNEQTQEVPAALLNYIFKYQMPDKTETRYTYRQSLEPESTSFNHIQTVPGLVRHHDTAKYSILPEFKIPELSQLRQPGGTIGYVSAAQLPKLTYINGNQQALTLGASYSTENMGQPLNYASNLIQLDRGNQFSGNIGQQIDLQQLGQSEQFSQQFGHLAQATRAANQLGEFTQFGHQTQQQTQANPFGQGGLQLQLGGYAGIDYSALTNNAESSRGSQNLGLDIGKVGLSLQEPARSSSMPTYAKLSFGQPLW